jgi:hypothetical protein
MFDEGKPSITAYNPKINQNTLSGNLAVACFVPNKKCCIDLARFFVGPNKRVWSVLKSRISEEET